MNYDNDKRIVATLDAGGTNFVFSAIQGKEEVVDPIRLNSNADNLELCLETIRHGFREVIAKLDQPPVAISFAFPGPADYARGIIGDLGNLPAFRGGVALGPMLEAEFGIPVFINNDGSLFAYGEALAGALPEINATLEGAGSPKRYKNLFGITLGTGFGGGVVINDELLIGDNSFGGDIWCYRNKKFPHEIIETSVSIRAVKRVYAERSADSSDLDPKDIFDIAEGVKEGDRKAAVQAFAELGEMAGDVVCHAITTIDGLIVIGGGLAGASKYIVPGMVAEMNSTLECDGTVLSRMQVKVYDLTDEEQLKQFLDGETVQITIPGTDKKIPYQAERKIGVMLSSLGANKAISLGAYAFALHKLDS
ncbi:ROK family protein [Pontiella sulfatireligans]|uniref:N-acetyl-D-glucosamine kinase n=1 Tax=Pontiella sulfatireligans TaxID=2750658 RepID=A0A6C2UFU0_9BACT|nr:ROK family protein [Pontiella sulfatireligans]VGO18397.1 N-acetyl-D-glucosamine kinase [Pontiella sulfatireligans]